MGKKSNLKQQRRNGNAKVMDLIHYTEESYLEVFPQASSKDYVAYLLQDEEARVRGMEKAMDVYFSKIRRILIDEEYFQWLKENKLKNSPENRIRYGARLNDEEVVRLWDKNKMEKTVVTRVLPFMAVSKEILPVKNFSIADEMLKEVKGLLAQSFHVAKDRVFLHPELIRAENCTQTFLDKEFVENAELYFEGKNQASLKTEALSVQKEEQPYMVRFLPVAILSIEKPLLTRKEFNKEAWGLPKLPEVALKSWAINVLNELGEETDINPIPVMLEQTEMKEFYDGFIEKMTKQKVKVGN